MPIKNLLVCYVKLWEMFFGQTLVILHTNYSGVILKEWQRHLRYSSETFYHNYILKNTTDVTGGKPIAPSEHSLSLDSLV
jgi:hypothetical protein